MATRITQLMAAAALGRTTSESFMEDVMRALKEITEIYQMTDDELLAYWTVMDETVSAHILDAVYAELMRRGFPHGMQPNDPAN